MCGSLSELSVRYQDAAALQPALQPFTVSTGAASALQAIEAFGAFFAALPPSLLASCHDALRMLGNVLCCARMVDAAACQGAVRATAQWLPLLQPSAAAFTPEAGGGAGAARVLAKVAGAGEGHPWPVPVVPCVVGC